MDQLPAYGLANTATAFATLFGGVFPVLFCWVIGRQPMRWVFVYWMIVVTGIFTITLHGFGQTNPVWGERWFWSFLDTGSNIVVTWAIALAVLGDYYQAKTRRWAVPLVTLLMIAGTLWHYYERMPSTGAFYVIPLGAWGGFCPGEFSLISFAWLNVFLMGAKWIRIPQKARPAMLLVVCVFFIGLISATAGDDEIVYPFIAVHAIWHVIGAFGFMSLWAFNHVRFSENQAVTMNADAA